MISLEQYQKTDTIYPLTWNPNWVCDLESPWSIFEKIKYSNRAEKRDLFSVFGSDRVRHLKSVPGIRDHNLYTLYAFDDNAFMDILGFRLKQYTLDCIIGISGFLHKNDILHEYLRSPAANNSYRYFRSNIHFCLDCMKSGYHSILHQFKLMHYCPFHLTRLLSACPECHTSVPYELSDRYFQAPFVCNCGYAFMEYKNPYHSEWGKLKIEHVRDQSVSQWLTLSQEEKLCLSWVHLYYRNDLDKIPDLLNFLFDCINKHTIEYEAPNLIRSYSPIFQKTEYPHINANDTGKVNQMEPIESWFELESFRHNARITRILSELEQSSNLTMKSISKYLRNTLLSKHKSCIKRFTNISKEKGAAHPPICPFAYAYVMWKKSLWGIPKYYDVEDKPFYREGSTLQKISSVCDRRYIVDLLDAWIRRYPIRTPNDFNRLKWMIDKATGHLALLHFKTWLKKAPYYAANFKIAYYPEIMENETPVFAFSFPEAPDLSVSFISRPDEEEWNWLLEASNIICPYPTIRKRRKKPTEISHHPLRLAMEKINEADRAYVEKNKKFKSI